MPISRSHAWTARARSGPATGRAALPGPISDPRARGPAARAQRERSGDRAGHPGPLPQPARHRGGTRPPPLAAPRRGRHGHRRLPRDLRQARPRRGRRGPAHRGQRPGGGDPRARHLVPRRRRRVRRADARDRPRGSQGVLRAHARHPGVHSRRTRPEHQRLGGNRRLRPRRLSPGRGRRRLRGARPLPQAGRASRHRRGAARRRHPGGERAPRRRLRPGRDAGRARPLHRRSLRGGPQARRGRRPGIRARRRRGRPRQGGRPAARHRQDRDLRRHPQQAGQAHRRRVEGHEGPHDHRRAHPARHPRPRDASPGSSATSTSAGTARAIRTAWPGDAIPIGSRIILACDAYHAMTSDRPYREAMTHAEAIAELAATPAPSSIPRSSRCSSASCTSPARPAPRPPPSRTAGLVSPPMPSRGASEVACAWCGAPLPEEGRGGRTRCPACGVATTTPWPSPQELEAAYAGLYRPGLRPLLRAGRPLLRRSRGRARAAARPDRAPRAGARRRRRRRRAGRRAAPRAGARRVGLEREAAGPRRARRRGRRDRRDLGGGRLLALARAPARRRRGPRPRRATCSRRAGVLVVAIPNPDSLQARAFGDRWLAPRPAPPPRPRAGAGAARRACATLGLRVERVSHLRGGQVVFGWLHGLVGPLPGRPDLYDAIRRPEARSAPLGAGRAPRRSPPPSSCSRSPPWPARWPRPPLRRGGTRLRGGPPCLSARPGRSSS